MDVKEVPLRGRHVILEPLREEHAEALWPAASEADLWRYMTFSVRTPEDLRRWVTMRLAARDAGTALPFLQRDARTGEAYGSTSLFDISREHRTLEIGHTWLGASHRRTPANTEAKLLLLTHAFETLGAVRVQLKTDRRNERSQRAIERLGAVREGVLRNHFTLPDGYVRDTVMYSLVPAEWPAVKARLEGMLGPPELAASENS